MIVSILVTVLVLLGVVYAAYQAQLPGPRQTKGGSMLKVVYVFFAGLLLATFVGVGIATFYEAPKAPEYPSKLEYRLAEPGEKESAEDVALRKDFDERNTVYQEAMKPYARNVSLIALGFALLAALLGLLLADRLDVVADGILLGGFFTLLYSIGWGFATEDNRYRFLMVSIGLLVLLAFGYSKFVQGVRSKR